MDLSRNAAYLLLFAVSARFLVPFPEDPQIQPISHVLFFLVALMLVLMSSGARRWESWKLGLAVCSLFGSLWVGMHLLFGDPTLLASWSRPSSYATYPGCPSWGTVIGLVGLSASGLIFQDSAWRYLSGGLPGLLGLIALLGHLFSYPPLFYALPFSSGMAPSTALFLLLGSAVVVRSTAHWRTGYRRIEPHG